MIKPMRALTKYYSHHLLLALAMTIATLLFFSMLSPFFESIALAAIFGLGIYAFLERVCLKLYSRPQAPPFKFIIGFYIFFLGTFGLFVSTSLLKLYDFLVGEKKEATAVTMNSLITSANLKFSAVKPYIDSWLKTFNIRGTSYEDALQNMPGEIFSASAAAVSLLPHFTIQAIVFVVMLNFFLVSHKSIYRFVAGIGIFSEDDMENLANIMKTSSYESLTTNAIVGILQASLVTLGAALCGFNEWMLIFFITFIVSFIPVVGGSSIAFVLALSGFVTDNTSIGLAMIVVGCITGVSDNIFRSYLVSNSKDKGNPMLIFVAIIGAVYIFGFSGLFIGPFVLHMCLHLLPYVFPSMWNKTPNFRAEPKKIVV